MDQILRLFLISPDMHRVHHSVVPAEKNSNFGFNLPWWDRVFGTYKAQPQKGHTQMNIGLKQYKNPNKTETAEASIKIFIKLLVFGMIFFMYMKKSIPTKP